MSPHAQPEDLRALMTRSEGLMAPQAKATDRPLSTAPKDHKTARDHATCQPQTAHKQVSLRWDRRGGTTQKLCSNAERRYNKHEGSNVRERRPLTDVLAQVPNKTPLARRNVNIGVCTGRLNNNSAEPQGNTSTLCC